ncbi:MAG: hypothetical protein JNK15_12340 [Planctomycetes bacterium]|nr:hypothetical protein [Planctomycetota bacterium]
MFRHLAIAAFAAICSAQAPLVPGYRDVAWPNTSDAGTPYLFSRVLYPSHVGGNSAPVAPKTGGWPVIVLLHGFSFWGQHYVNLGEALARSGFVVMQLDTGIWNYLTLEADARAALPALVAANASADDFFHDAFDTARIGLAGHSMGGGVAGLVLANNPGYRCGFGFAPVAPSPTVAAAIDVPFGIVVGEGDTITPWQMFSVPFFQSLAPTTGLKFCHVLDQTCDHMNVAGLGVAGDAAFVSASAVAAGFFRSFLAADPTGLERCIGPRARAAANFTSCDAEFAEPLVWSDMQPRLGRTVRVSIASAGGFGGILAAGSVTSGLPTSYGTFWLDPATTYTWVAGHIERHGRIDVMLSTPNNASLVGVTLALQAVGDDAQQVLKLGTTGEFTVR